MLMPTHLLVDYGEVISKAQPEAATAGMAALVGMPTESFRERYWGSREEYDRGLPATEYWDSVVGHPVHEAERAELRRLDLESWTQVNSATVTALQHAHRRGARLTLLSNAPHDLAAEVGRLPAVTDIFSLLLFSADLRLVKPSAEIFEVALSLTASAPEDTLFIDDRVQNIRAADALGMRTHHFTAAEKLDATLRGIDFAPTRDLAG